MHSLRLMTIVPILATVMHAAARHRSCATIVFLQLPREEEVRDKRKGEHCPVLNPRRVELLDAYPLPYKRTKMIANHTTLCESARSTKYGETAANRAVVGGKYTQTNESALPAAWIYGVYTEQFRTKCTDHLSHAYRTSWAASRQKQV
jgi:hypothetical protein